jgi:hypothetical protein
MENWVKLSLNYEPTGREQNILAGAIAMVMGKELTESEKEHTLDILKDNAIGIMLEKPLTEEQANRLANVLRKTIPDHDLEISM